MTKAIPLRTWATPLTIGSFILMSVSGVLMFFHWDTGLTAGAHQWCAWLFLLGAGSHVTANFRPFRNHLNSRWGRISIAAFATLLAASVFSWGLVTGSQLERPIVQALVDAPLSSLASVTHAEPDALVQKFKTHGIAATPEQSIRQLSNAHGVGADRLLALVFLPE
ncbi:MAG: DUF4405 domain-containing protein [Burkholderiaceae bacterium]|jgi:hypothetical protein|nr:DUF4405 domain-containing protein [Burkholderiaceae bacterium]